MRGAGPLYDLGHFHLHDGHRFRVGGFGWLIDGYVQAAPLPADYEEQVGFMGLLMGIRRLARSFRVHSAAIAYQGLMADSIRRELAILHGHLATSQNWSAVYAISQPDCTDRHDCVEWSDGDACEMNHDDVLKNIVAWAMSEDNVRAVVLTGSAARGGDELHILSDLDVELYAAEPLTLLDDDAAWYAQFGDVLVVEALPNPGWHPTRLIYFVGGKIDFMVAPAEALPATRYARPFRVLVDKDGVTRDLPGPTGSGDVPPDSTAFLECVQWFYAAALMCAKCVVREEPWLAKIRDWDLKRQLLRMIEWDHKARYSWSYDTWYDGKHLNRWVDDEILSALHACWADFAVSEVAKSLPVSIDLFERLSSRTARSLALDHFDAGAVRREVHAILALA